MPLRVTLPKPVSDAVQLVRPRRQIRRGVASGNVADDLARRARVGLLDDNRDARQHRVGGVVDRPKQRRSALRARDTRQSEYHDREHEDTKGREAREAPPHATFATFSRL